MKYLLKIILLVSVIAPLKAQKASGEIKLINAYYEQHKRMSMDVKYLVYSGHMSSIPVEVTEGTVKRDGNLYFQKFGELLFVQNTSYYFAVDAESKSIDVGDPKKEVRSGAIEGSLDSLLKYAVKATVFPMENNVRKLIFQFPMDMPGEFEKVEIYYSSRDYSIQRMVLYYSQEESMDDEGKAPAQKPRMEIKYYNINDHPEFGREIFSEKKFFTQQGGRLACSSAFQDYQLKDLRLKQK